MSGKQLLLTSLFLLFALLNFAQKGTLRGKIIDKENAETLIGATIVVDGTTIGASSDFDGNYSLSLDPGTYNIRVSYVSYEPQIFEGIKIAAGEVTLLNAQLSTANLQLGEVVVKARARQRTETAMQVLQKKSPQMLDGISFEQISKLGDGDAAQALKRVTGVSVQGGKYVYVRGLGDRYTKITLNGAEIPGLDPEKNTVQMDIFPSNIIENIIVHKTFTPDLPGESTGGHVDVITKDFPEKFTFQFSTSFAYNPQSSLNDQFMSYEGGNLDWTGLDDGTRDIPNVASEALDRMIEQDLGQIVYPIYSANELNDISSSFNTNMEPQTKTSFLDHSHKISIGDQVDFLGKSMGYNIAVSYARDFSYYNDGSFVVYDEENPVPWKDMADEQGSEEAKIAGLINLNFKLSDNSKVGLRFLRNQSGKSLARSRFGYFNYEDSWNEDRNLAYLERSFNSYQLHGKHVIPSMNKAIVEWISSYTAMQQDEPDLRFFENLFDVDGTDTTYRIKTNDKPARFYRTMQENNFANKLDFEVPLSWFNNSAKFKMGGAYTYKYRNLDDIKFDLFSYSTQFSGDIKDYLENNIFSTSNPNGYFYTADHQQNLNNSYVASQHVIAGYAMLDFSINKKLRVVTGLRIEDSYIFTENKVDESEIQMYDSGELDEIDFLPALNLTYFLNDDMNLRMAASRTLARPQFKEIGTSYYDYKTSSRVNGNPDLERAVIDNYDLRWEYFFKPGEKVALSGFYKYFNNPIEQRLDPLAENRELKYFNTDDSYLYGFEIELRKKLDFVDLLKDFSIGGNYTWVKSIVEIPADILDEVHQTDPDRPAERPMLGQAPYVLNLYMSYDNDDLGLSTNFGFNVAGEKLLIITQGGTPYVYEQPRPDLNFNVNKDIGEKYTLEFGITNLLNSEHKAVHHFDEGDYAHYNYMLGRSFKLGIKYLIK